MATTGIDNCSPYGMACIECNDLLVAPKWSAYVSKHEVRHFYGVAPAGRRTVNTEPLPGSLVTVTSPPIMRASLRVMASPRPVPPKR
jgi:hypothetical protein